MTTPVTGDAKVNPFPGLRPFREEEEYLFFGRESQVDAMVTKLSATQFLAVVGTSGSGKSSLVNCGLRPALHGGLMASAGTAWRMAQFRPGSDPLGAMASALAKDGALFRDYDGGSVSLAELVETTLRMSKLGLIDIYENAHLEENVNLLVVVDQFEELFRYRGLQAGGGEDAHGVSEEAVAFVNLLLEAQAQAEHPIYIVITMRSDFLGDCAQFAGLADAINAGQYLVPRMTRDERRAAISGPVGVGGARISPVLLTRLVNDVGDNPDQLSILQHALNRTWSAWEDEGDGEGPLDLPQYESVGTMARALDRHAEDAYGELESDRQKEICEALFKALTDKATDSRGVRRPTTLGILDKLADATQAEVVEVVDVFRDPSRSFLMPPAGEELDADSVIDISHESLMRVWERLKTWADEEAESVVEYQRFAESARRWKAGHAELLQGRELDRVQDWSEKQKPTTAWAERYGGDFEQAKEFLRQSVQARDKKRRNAYIAAGAIAVILFAIGMIFAAQVSKTNLANKAADERNNYLRGIELEERASRALKSNRVTEAWLYTLKALDLEIPEDRALPLSVGRLASIRRSPEQLRSQLSGVAARVVEISDDGMRLAAGAGNDVYVWSRSTGKLEATLRGHRDEVRCLSFSKGGKWLASGAQDGTVRVWNVMDRKGEPDPLRPYGGEVYAVSFSGDGTRLAAGSLDGNVQVWDTGDFKKPPVALKGGGDLVESLSFSPDGKVLGAGYRNAEAIFWNLDSGKDDKVTIGNRDEGTGKLLGVSGSGRWLAEGASGLEFGRWPEKTVVALNEVDGIYPAVAFSGNGSLMAVSTRDAIRIWDREGVEKHSLALQEPVKSMSLSNDGTWLVTVLMEKVGKGRPARVGSIQLWRLGGPETPVAELVAGRSSSAVAEGGISTDFAVDGGITSLARSPSGKVLAAGNSEGSVRVWRWGKENWEPLGGIFDKKEHEAEISGLAFSADNQVLVSISEDAVVKDWNLAQPEEKPVDGAEHDAIINGIALGSGGSVLSGDEGGNLKFWKRSAPETTIRVAAPKVVGVDANEVWSVAFIPGATHAVAGYLDGTIRRWNPNFPDGPAQLVDDWLGHDQGVTGFKFSSVGSWFATTSWDQTVRLWATNELEKEPVILRGSESGLGCMDISLDEKWLAAGTMAGIIHLWKLTTADDSVRPRAKLVATWSGEVGPESAVTGVSFAPDGQLISSGDSGLKLWDLDFLRGYVTNGRNGEPFRSQYEAIQVDSGYRWVNGELERVPGPLKELIEGTFSGSAWGK